MIINCVIIDDEPIARKGMLEYISQVHFLQVTGVYDNAIHASENIKEKETGIIFLDIEMPKISGIEFIRSLKYPPLVIITTAYPNYAHIGYELDVVDYLVKPIAFPRFLKAVNKAKELLSARDPSTVAQPAVIDCFFVKENGRFIKIFFADILYVEALQNYVAIHLAGKKVITYITLSLIEKQLPAVQFMRVHKSYIVALNKVDSIEGNMIRTGTANIPVSRTVKDQLMKKVLENKLLRR